MAVVLQGNINRSRVAHDLLAQISLEKAADIILISEQYRARDGPGWYEDTLGTAAIWIPNQKRFPVADHGSGSGFVWVKSSEVTYVSCYFTPNERIADFQAKLDGLEDAVRDMEGKLVVAGDFNAKALEWGEPWPDSRGGRLLDMVSRVGLVVLNTGSSTTFRRPGYRETIIDVSLSTERLASRVEEWMVIDDYTASDHQYITFRVCDVIPVRSKTPKAPAKWNVNKMGYLMTCLRWDT
ncbi:uncharacterized protein LOC128668525 [Microplitis demolitor]|uniref:uncharacterized protein LOC128668525 n=1 Tax=Microplitis demolitor TaxID=69319 RepID=UPI00235B6108|nr:uncharacterized protein LOC128668525 [Microplitis demolitor]